MCVYVCACVRQTGREKEKRQRERETVGVGGMEGGTGREGERDRVGWM